MNYVILNVLEYVFMNLINQIQEFPVKTIQCLLKVNVFNG